MAKLATEIKFQPVDSDDLEVLLERIAISENIAVGDKVCRLMADQSFGDARRAIMMFEMLGELITR